MPLFSVLCTSHGEFELLVDKLENAKCPQCGKDVERVWSCGDSFRIQYKSDGFYSTMYNSGKDRLI